ncbi:hypothetical protein G6M26_06580 [Agrobacterium tumefaciens]|nr:hypothetical protein [Agrobacterium tumefaciens]NTE18182.1 hypothetical protein [Agrobacterium tumefaciens]
MIDPDGRETKSTHTDKFGSVVAVYDDGDKGVYKHDGNSKQTRKELKESYSEDNTSGGGQKMGETEYIDEFVSPGSGKLAGTNEFSKLDGRIEFDKSWDGIIDSKHKDAKDMDLRQIGEESKSSTEKRIYKFDIKANKKIAQYGPMTGRLLDGKYASARSAGNYLAGYNGRTGTYFGVHISLTTYMKLAGALQQNKYNKTNAAKIVLFGTSYRLSPWYGEIEYTGRMVTQGWNSSRK